MYQSMTTAPVLPFRGKDRSSGFSGSLSCVSASLLSVESRRKLPVNVYILAICFVIGMCFHAGAQSNTVEGLETQAYVWMHRGRADKAAEVWRKLLLLQPRHATALSELAVHNITVGALTESHKLLQVLQETNPNDRRIASVAAMLATGEQVMDELREARSLSKAGRHKDAFQHYRKAFGETEPTTLSGLEYYQVLAATPDGWDAAHAGIKRLTEMYPEATHVQLALALHLTYKPSTRIRGIRLLQQLTSNPVVSNEANAGWRQAVDWLGESPQAYPLLKAYVDANPQDNELRHRLELLGPRLARQKTLDQAYKALEKGEIDKAEELFKSIHGTERDPDVLGGLASIALAREDFDEAARLLNKARQIAPRRPELWQSLLYTTEFWQSIKRAEVLRREGRLDEAQALLEQTSVPDATERYHAVLALVDLLIERGDLPKARHWLHELMAAPPAEAASLRWMVSLLLRASMDQQAIAVNEKLRGIDSSAAFPDNGLKAEQLRQRAMHLRRAGDVIAARDALVTAASLDPAAPWVMLDLVHLDLELGNIDEAHRSIEALLTIEPEMPEAVLVAARIAEMRGEYERGLELLGTIASGKSDEVENLRRSLEIRLAAARAVRTFRTGGVSTARMQLSTLERAAPTLNHLAIVAEAFADIGEVDHAVLMLHAKGTALADVPGVQLQIAALLLRAGRTSESKAILDELAARPGLTPAELVALQKLRIGCAVRVADLRRSQGDLAGARRELAPWTGIRPLEPQIANAYGRVLHDDGDYPGAAKQYSYVLKQDPGNFDALQGLTYAALGDGIDLAEARHALQQGLHIHNGDPRLHLFIARLDARAESYTDALEELAKANRLVEDKMHSTVTFTLKGKSTNKPPLQIQQPEVNLENLHSEIQVETQRVRAAAGIKLRPEFTMRSRQGEPGRHALFELTAPSRLEFPNPWGTLSLQITPIHLSAGRLVLEGDPDELPFGTVEDGTGERDISAEGVALGVGYKHRNWQLDLGVTPVNFARSEVVGGLSCKFTFRDIALILEASRRAVEESVLSFAGVTDPGTGQVWGAVVKQGGALTLRHDGRGTRSYAVLDYNYLTGKDVKQNHSLTAHLGIRWELRNSISTHLETGIAASAMAFERNLSEFSYGHGGYFSPQRFVHFGLPINWQGSFQAMTWRLDLEPGVTWFQLDEAPYYPLSSSEIFDPAARYKSRESLGLGVDGVLELSYALTPQISFGSRAELHTGDDHREICAGAYLRFALKGGGGVNQSREP